MLLSILLYIFSMEYLDDHSHAFDYVQWKKALILLNMILISFN